MPVPAIPHPRAFIATLGALICISAIAVDASMPALPLIASAFGAPVSDAQLVISLYLAGYGLGQIPAGLLSDRYGRRPILLCGLALFTLAGVAATLSPTVQLLWIARFLQGLGGAAGPSLGRAVIRDTASGVRAAQLMGTMVTLLGVATLGAPLLGSLLVPSLGWRSTMAVSVLLGLAVTAAIGLFVPETRPPQTGHGSAAAQLRMSTVAFFTTARCIWGAALVALAFGGYMIVVAVTAPVLVGSYGFPIGWIGPLFALAAVAYLLGGVASRRIVERLGVDRLLALAVGVFALAAIVLAGVALVREAPFAVFWGGVSLYLLGIGLLLPSATAIALEPLPQAVGFSAAIVGTAQIGAAAGSTALAALVGVHTSATMAGIMAGAGALTALTFVVGPRTRRTIA